jgi:hypothetical protein
MGEEVTGFILVLPNKKNPKKNQKQKEARKAKAESEYL